MNIGPIQLEVTQHARSLRLKDAVLASFYEPAPSVRARLGEFNSHDWNRAKYWLDVSGLALYFLDRLTALNLESCIPCALLTQLRTNLVENRERTESLLQEAVLLTEKLRERHIQCALLKGVTLPPESISDFALRNQMDIDLLIGDADANATKDCLGELGYSLDAISGSTWEFKTGPSATSSLKNLYQVRPERAIEVHTMRRSDSASDRLSRARRISIRGHELPGLSSPDSFVLQSQHLFKHMCGEHTRASWVLEYWRHICARQADLCFWREVESIAASEPGAGLAIGAAVLLTSLLFGPCAPPALARWSSDQLPPSICLWIQLYGRRVLVANRPGSKLYLLLRKELDPHSPIEAHSRRRLLFPFHMPQRITRATENESIGARLVRYRMQALFVVRRLRFHVSEDLRLAIESFRWQRRIAGGSQ